MTLENIMVPITIASRGHLLDFIIIIVYFKNTDHRVEFFFKINEYKQVLIIKNSRRRGILFITTAPVGWGCV